MIGNMIKFCLLKKCLFIFLGSISVALGVIGAFVPVLPTTPFLLLASFFYLRSSKRLYHWLMDHKILGAYIYNYLTYKAIPKKTKVFVIAFLWATTSLSFLLVPILFVRVFLVAIGLGVTVHLLRLKTLPPDQMK